GAVTLPYYDQELAWLISASNTTSNPNDNISSQAELGLSKYSGPLNVNHLWADNCPPSGNGGTTWQGPNAVGGYGNLSANPPVSWPANTDKFSKFNITGFSEFWLHGSTVVTPLVIELTHFSASCLDSKVEIRWNTASEKNSVRFIVERSRDGVNWDDIAIVDGAGTT